jgi:SagB-type dehydrogenase family enzyme
MTRFLPRVLGALEDPESAGVNGQTERLFEYHQATKHTYQSVRASAHFLDWRNQPNPFRTYEGAPLVTLAPDPGFPDMETFAAIGALDGAASITGNGDSGACESVRLDATWISRLLWHSMAVSAWKKVPGSGSRYSLRVNPSSGNLHPTETYLALRGVADIRDGLYHYRADVHALELRSEGQWTQTIAEALQVPRAADASLIIGLTSIFWREAWKYRERAYRYCCHDLGHAMMSILLSARALGLPGGAIGHFGDTRLTSLLGLTGSDEAPMTFLAFPIGKNTRRSDSTSFAPTEKFAGEPNELSAEEAPYKLLLGMHASTILPDAPLPLLRAALLNVPAAECPQEQTDSPEPARDRGLGMIARRRRSALDFDPRTSPMPRADLEQLLDFSTRDWLADWRGNFEGAEFSSTLKGSDVVTLYLFVHRVDGCEPGVYRWDGTRRTLQQLHRGNAQRVAAFLSLEQMLAGNSCFTVSMVADLAAAALAFGNRGYRYAYFEAGAIGQRLYLGAEALGWNATGIGAFYDDDVHRYLGFLEEVDGSVSHSVNEAEQSTLVMLNLPASRYAAEQKQKSKEDVSAIAGADDASLPAERESREEKIKARLPTDSSKLPMQVIYHFAVGRAVADPRIED